jgi:hypothetical protein
MLQRGEDGAESTATPYLSTSSTSRADTSFSPDGQWICYGSNESGHQELYVQRFSAPSAGADDARAGRWKISTGGGRCPWWRADGRELRYVDDERRLMSVQVETAPSFSVSTPAPLLRLGDLETFGEPRFTDDGRILAILQGGAGELTRIDLVLNWFAELEASVPMPQR